ncbi:ATP-grasp domain-containing protein [Streptomyces californicus]
MIAVAPDADAAVALCEKACAAIRVTTTPDPAE